MRATRLASGFWALSMASWAARGVCGQYLYILLAREEGLRETRNQRTAAPFRWLPQMILPELPQMPKPKVPRREAMTGTVLTFPSTNFMRVVRATDEFDTEGVAAGVRIGGGAGDVDRGAMGKVELRRRDYVRESCTVSSMPGKCRRRGVGPW